MLVQIIVLLQFDLYYEYIIMIYINNYEKYNSTFL